MSRRHSASRRRNYGRRRHEVRERRPGLDDHRDSSGPRLADDWQLAIDDDRRSNGAADGRGMHGQ